ncbi:class I SAM-dependent methyltransferase [Neobacillus sp. CF12]|uniref:class I SAM-dependent methyltransferase n=1 Tax=Neobacillus sp. CF12 TaxID=3055864 RepID=UPI0025A01073|nr:class I SAM-dependent methyltransferase [Neobacillus sp. CF12]MDM5331322.1 class I SAM-dependent methyltransferase [Neobacillus sp. CF12]
MFVTTAGRTNQHMVEKAIEIAELLQVPYIKRQKKSILTLQKETNSECIVVGKERLELFHKEALQPFFFHPNSAMFRIKRLERGEHDPFAQAAQLKKGMTFLDCTLGLASDSIVASYLVGNEGVVTGTEGQNYLAFIVREGLKTWDSELQLMNEAMARIKVVNCLAIDYIKTVSDHSIDCVYFDPMFDESILESDGIKALGHFALYEEFNKELIDEALRVSKYRVLLKDHYKSKRFEQYGFNVFRRKTAKFHFGVLEK